MREAARRSDRDRAAGRLIDPAAGVDGATRPAASKTAGSRAVDKPGTFRTTDVARRIDARGCWVVPGLIDMHVPPARAGLRVQGDRARPAPRAAVAGGFTARRLHGQHQPGQRQRRGDAVHPRARRGGRAGARLPDRRACRRGSPASSWPRSARCTRPASSPSPTTASRSWTPASCATRSSTARCSTCR